MVATTRARRRACTAVVAAVVGGLVVWPASPVAAAEVTYVDVPCESVFEFSSFDEEITWTMSAQGPSAAVAPGETFTLSNLVVTEHRGFHNHEGELTVLGGQVIELGFSENTGSPDFFHEWVVGDVELTAPMEFGVHGIFPEATWHRSPDSGASFLGYFCPREGESFPDEPFAFVEVADVDPTPTTTTTTTTVPVNGNGDDVDPNGDVDPEAEARAQAEAEAEAEREAAAAERAATEAVEAAEAALLVGASPRFTG